MEKEEEEEEEKERKEEEEEKEKEEEEKEREEEREMANLSALWRLWVWLKAAMISQVSFPLYTSTIH